MQTSTFRLPLLRRMVLLLPLLCWSFLSQAYINYDAPLYGSISYQTSGSNNQQVRYKATVGGSVWEFPSRPYDDLPKVGDKITYAYFDCGDGTAPVDMTYTVTYIGDGEFRAEAYLDHSYAKPGNYIASLSRCCMFSTQQNNYDKPLTVRTVVAAGAANDSPIAMIASNTALTQLSIKAPLTTATYQMVATDPNGDALTYSLATAADVGESGFVNAPGLSVNARTGLVTFDNTKLVLRDPDYPEVIFLNAVIKVSDGKTSVLVNHVIRVEQIPASTPPVVTVPSGGQGIPIEAAPGHTLSFVVGVRDADVGDHVVLIMQSNGTTGRALPATATLTPTPPVGGNTAQSTFSWTPTGAESGTYNILFVATDSKGLTGVDNVIIHVNPLCDPAATQPVANADQLRTPVSTPLTFTPAQLLANDTDPQGRPLQVGSIGKPNRGSLVTNADGSYTYTPAPGFVGSVSIPYQVQLAGPVFASAATGHYYEFVSAPGIDWRTAFFAAQSRYYQGHRGYLATITSAAETSALKGRFPGQYWMGAKNLGEGDWRWANGPEFDQAFWQGNASGTAFGYANWLVNQPDNYKNAYRPIGENYAVFYGGSGLWNDLDVAGSGASVAGYLVEYGGEETCTATLFATGTVTITVGGAATKSHGMVANATVDAPAFGLEALPNPNAGQFQLRVTAGTEGPAQVDLYDLQGRRVKAVFAGSLQAGEVRELSVDAPELAAGVYLVRLQSGQQVQHLRIAIQK
jgi:hypothetical protein